jgi:putative ABC transport system permease protein
MSFVTALSLSFRNLLTKKTRTFVTAFAGSIGIIGIALVLALSNGFSIYINKLQADALSYYPINIGTQVPTDTSALSFIRKPKENEFPNGETVYRINREDYLHINNFTDEYVEYLSKMDPHIYSAIKYSRYIAFNVLNKSADSENNPVYNKLTINWNEMVDNPGLIINQYELLKGRMPENMNEMILVLNSYNQVSSRTLTGLGIPYEGNESFTFNDFLDLEYRLILNNDYYFQNDGTGKFGINPLDEKMYTNENAVPLKVVGILRIKSGTTAGILNEGVNYTEELTEHVLNNETVSDIVIAQKNDQANTVFGGKFPEGDAGRSMYKQLIRALGGDTTPTGINIYPVDFNSKALIKDYLDAYNLQQNDDKDKILYTDFSEIAAQLMNTMINSVSYILIAFTAVSLVVSSIMIGIITYVSVIERTKEIGVLRSIGARKKDISRVFNAETVIIGFTAGLIGIILSFALTFPINIIIRRLVKEIGANMAILSPFHGILLIAVSILLTLIAGFIPSRIASRKDPVVALRTE